MFYETAHTVGPGWQRSFKPSHYEDMSWSPSSSHFRSPGASPETYRRRIHTDDEFPYSSKENDDEFFRHSPTFPRRIFKEVWTETSPNAHRFGDRPRMFKRVFRPNQWEDEFERDVPDLRRVDRGTRKFDGEFDRRFQRDLKKDIEDEFEKSEGRVHHIPIMVERRMEDLKSKFGKKSSPPERPHDEEYSEDWEGPQVQRLRKTFEKDDGFPSRHFRNQEPRSRVFSNISDTWDPHAVHTLPTRKGHKSSQSFDDSRHPVPPKHVYRSYSETHEDIPKPQPQHSAAFRSHSDGHCPNQTYVTKIEVGTPVQKEEQCSTESPKESPSKTETQGDCDAKPEPESRPKGRGKQDCAALQQIAVVLQNVEDLVQRVEGYTGTGRDKQYRFLDEMLTRCMLRLDDVDTEGREDIRSARKDAVREVQSCIDRLEAKANESERLQRLNVIPLGYVPRKEEPKEGDKEVKESGESKQVEESKEENGEQTKL